MKLFSTIAFFYFRCTCELPMSVRCHMLLPSGATSRGQLVKHLLPSTSFSFSVTNPSSPASRLSPPPPALLTLSVIGVEGRVEMQRLCYLKQPLCREGQTVGRLTIQPNTTAGDKHTNNQRRWSNYQWNDLRWHLVGMNKQTLCLFLHTIGI